MALDGLKNLVNSLSKFNWEVELDIIVTNNLDKVIELQQEQMMEGKGVDGEFIRPFYSENPYFKTPEAAHKYALWKAKITPNSKRPLDVPNLYINGYYQGSIKARVSAKTLAIGSDSSISDAVEDVHKNALGLNAEKRLQFATEITLPEITKAFKEQTGLDI
jgi:hypothetical protein